MTTTRVAVVTGANKGIGYGIVRNLCQQFDGDVVLTARDEARGNEAVNQIRKEFPDGRPLKFHQLDIDDTKSIERFRDFLKTGYGGLDVLVANAAIAYKGDDPTPFGEQAEKTIATNFTGTLNTCRILFPLLREHARVVIMSSRAGPITNALNSKIRERLAADNLNMNELEKIMQNFVALAKNGDLKGDWKKTAYGASKTGVTAMTRILQLEIEKDNSGKDILVNSVCPGYIKTDMTSQKGIGSIEQGADTPTYLALLKPNDKKAPHGEFLAERRVFDWKNGENDS